jgi:hypothetical protein
VWNLRIAKRANYIYSWLSRLKFKVRGELIEVCSVITGMAESKVTRVAQESPDPTSSVVVINSAALCDLVIAASASAPLIIEEIPERYFGKSILLKAREPAASLLTYLVLWSLFVFEYGSPSLAPIVPNPILSAAVV